MGLTVLLSTSGCLLGLGRSSVASAPFGPDRATETVVTKSHLELGNHGGTILVADETKSVAGRRYEGGSLGVGAYAVVTPQLSRTWPKGLAGGTGIGWAAGVGGQLSWGAFGLAADYALRWLTVSYAGDFGQGQQLHGPSAYAAWAPVPWLGLELGGGPLWGRVGAGGRDDGLSLLAADASGYRVGTRANLFFSAGGDLQLQTVFRLEASWQSVWTAEPRLPPSLSTASLGAGLALTFF